MALSPQKFREIVFQALYSIDMGKAQEEAIVPLLMKELSVSKKNVRTAFEKAENIQQFLTEIDAIIKELSTSYEFDRIPGVERNVLRLALYEMLHEEDIPPKVAIAEGIRLARKFSTRESATFVNAVLDNAYKEKFDIEAGEE